MAKSTVLPSFTDSLRRGLALEKDPCPTCRQPRSRGGLRALAERIGIDHSTLWRFMQGKGVSSAVMDKIVRYLDSREKPGERRTR